ncbi:unnamed protein product [Cladocopium goreaui]|uniref:Uncharacterized protein n=1 Tax=Cladocopium goreaui TaxID=2562237 RepID=A0A9P1M5F2_9DINO|nr:unnamed protein product [Cladocopium goreaui]
MDVEYSRKMDLLTTFGFILAVNYVRHVVRAGVAWFAIPCSSWVFMSQGSTKRHVLRPKGSTKMRSTSEGSRLARRLMYLMELCYRKGIFYVVEQPISSLLFQYGPMRKMLRRHGACRVTTWLGAFNAQTLKPVVLWGTCPFLEKLIAQPSKLKRMQIRRIKSFLGLETVRVYVDSSGRKRCVRDPGSFRDSVFWALKLCHTLARI